MLPYVSMSVPRWLDRIWLVLIALSFALMAPIWIILMSQRFGWRFVTAGVLLALWWRYAPGTLQTRA